jgi:putative ABC transport system substrate-binding protein
MLSRAQEARVREILGNHSTVTLPVYCLDVRASKDIDTTVEAAQMAGERRSPALVATRVRSRTEISALAVKRRLPAVSMFVEFAEAGGLMAYGPSLRETFRRCGAYVDRILQGAKPGELPVERPEKFELVINRKPAKASAS